MSSSPHRRPPRRAVDALLVALLVLGLVGAASVLLVRRVVLEPSTYTSALVEAEAYERAYTEVLADPELADVVDDLLGDLDVAPGLTIDARVVGTNALRWSVPPSELQRGSEALLVAVLAHVRGDAHVLDADVDLRSVLDRIPSTGVTEARALLASARSGRATTLADYRTAIEAFLADLAAGEVPDVVPELVTAASPEAVADTIMDALGLARDDPARAQVTASVLAAAERDLLITLGAERVRGPAAEAAERLEQGAPGRELDVVDAVRDRTDRTRAEVVGALDDAADVAGWFGPVTAALAAGVAVVSAVAIVARNRRDGRRTARLLALGAGIAGVGLLVVWSIVARAIADPLDRAVGAAPAGWGLPAGLRSVLVDVRSSVADELTARVVGAAALLIGIGLAVAVIERVLASTRVGGAASRRPLWVATASAVVVLAVGGALTRSTTTEDEIRCNGHAELCARPYDEVVQAATHNSMSSPDVVQIWPEHDGDLRAQLDAGVRALLIDTHYWTPLVSAEQITDAEPLIPPDVAETMVRLAGPLAESRPGTYLCHNQCAFGGEPVVDGLRQVRGFLDDNPGDVVTLIIQDAITPADTEEAVREAGLEPFLHTHEPGDPWPTLGDMIERGERLVVFAEAEGPPPSWYGNAFDAMRETPYLFREPEDFSCEANRGDEDASLLLLNHWVSRIAPDRVDAVRVNTLEALVDRSRECAELRGALPNFLAVNFYDIGELMPAVDVLNEVG